MLPRSLTSQHITAWQSGQKKSSRKNSILRLDNGFIAMDQE